MGICVVNGIESLPWSKMTISLWDSEGFGLDLAAAPGLTERRRRNTITVEVPTSLLGLLLSIYLSRLLQALAAPKPRKFAKAQRLDSKGFVHDPQKERAVLTVSEERVWRVAH